MSLIKSAELPPASAIELGLLALRVPAPLRPILAHVIRLLISGASMQDVTKELQVQAALEAWRRAMKHAPP